MHCDGGRGGKKLQERGACRVGKRGFRGLNRVPLRFGCVCDGVEAQDRVRKRTGVFGPRGISKWRFVPGTGSNLTEQVIPATK